MAPGSRTLGVEIVGSAASLKAAMSEATAATEAYAAKAETAFRGVSDAALKAQLAQVKLARETEKYGVGTVGAAQALTRYRGEMDRMRASQLAAMQSVGRNLTTFVTLPTALLGAEAVKMGVEFQKQMLLIQTQAGDSTDSIKQLSAQVLQMAPAVAMGPTQLAQGLYHLVSLGLRGKQAMDTLRTASIAAGMGVANLEDVSTALGATVVSGIRGAQDYNQAMSTLVATVGSGNVRMGDLAGALGQVLAPAKNAGVSLTELGAAMAVLTDRGMSADLAATRLRMTFSLIQAPSKAAQKALSDMGINADELSRMIHQPNGLLNVLQTLHDAMQNVGTVRGSADILRAFGGGRSGAGILTLVQSLDSAVSSYQGKLAQIAKQQQDYFFNTQAYMESPSFNLHQTLAKIETDLTQIGEKLTPLALAAARTINGMVDAFDKLPGPIRSASGILLGLFALGGPLILGITGAVKLVGTLQKAFTRMPAEVAPALAATDAELAGVGSSAVAAETEVTSLRASLVGLGALDIVVPITLLLTQKDIRNNASNLISDIVHNKSISKTISDDLKTAGSVGKLIAKGFGIQLPSFGGRKSNSVPGAPVSPTASTLFGPGGPLNPSGLLTGGRTKDNYIFPGTAYHGGNTGSDAAKMIDKFAVPQQLLTALSRAQAGYGSLAKAEDDIRNYALKLLHSGRLAGAAQQQAWDTIASVDTKVTSSANKAAAAAKRKAEAEKKAAEAALLGREEKILGIGAAATPGVQALTLEERNILVDALAAAGSGPSGLQTRRGPKVVHNQGFGRVQRLTGTPAQQKAAARAEVEKATAHMGIDELVKYAEKMLGKDLPASARQNIAKINQILKLGIVGPDVNANLRARLSQLKQTLATGLASLNSVSSNYVKESSMDFVKGLNFATGADKKAAEQKFAQIQAHNGYAPVGAASSGIVINVHGVTDPDAVARKVVKHVQAAQKRGARQTRGRHGGNQLAVG